METERDRITKALEVLDDIDHNNRMLNFHTHITNVVKIHELLPPDLLKRALVDFLAHEPLADVPALVSKQAA